MNNNNYIYSITGISSSGGSSHDNIMNPNITNYINNLNFNSNTIKYGILKLYVNSQNTELFELYKTHIQTHNNAILNDRYPNSGFDLFIPNQTIFTRGNANQMVNHQVKCEMYFVDIRAQSVEPSAYMMYPRSSISKTEVMLSNHMGIIDSGYRGFLIGAFRWLKPENASHDNYAVDRYTRLLQICLPTLHPIFVVLTDESELANTERGVGGFGSTGL